MLRVCGAPVFSQPTSCLIWQPTECTLCSPTPRSPSHQSISDHKCWTCLIFTIFKLGWPQSHCELMRQTKNDFTFNLWRNIYYVTDESQRVSVASQNQNEELAVLHGMRFPSRLGCRLIDMRDGQELCHLVTLFSCVLFCNGGGLLSNGESFLLRKRCGRRCPETPRNKSAVMAGFAVKLGDYHVASPLHNFSTLDLFLFILTVPET